MAFLSRRNVLVAVVAAPSALLAQRHPDYRRALSDLRLARHLLNQPATFRVIDDQRRAVGRIDNAIRDIERAAVRDHQNLAWRQPNDVPRIPADRFRQARVAVESALRDIQQWEANPNAAGWQGRAVQDLNEAMRAIDFAIQDRRR
jgi:hypothetical protein